MIWGEAFIELPDRSRALRISLRHSSRYSRIIRAADVLDQLNRRGISRDSLIVAVAKKQAELRDARRKAKFGSGLRHGQRGIVADSREHPLFMGDRIGVVDRNGGHVGDGAIRFNFGDDFVECRDALAGSQIAAWAGTAFQFIPRKRAPFIAEQAIRPGGGRIEGNRNLYIACHRDQRTVDLIDENLFGFVERVDVGVASVARLGKPTKRCIREVLHSDAEHGQRDVVLDLIVNRRRQMAGVGRADIPISIGNQDDAAHAPGHLAVPPISKLIGCKASMPCPASHLRAGFEASNRRPDCRFFITGGRREHDAGFTAWV